MADLKRYGKFDPRDERDFESDDAQAINWTKIAELVYQQTRRSVGDAGQYVADAYGRMPEIARAKFLEIWADMGVASPARAMSAAYNWASHKTAHEWHMTDPDYREAFEEGRIEF